MDTDLLLIVVLILGYLFLLAGIHRRFISLPLFIVAVTFLTFFGVGLNEYWFIGSIEIAIITGFTYLLIWGIPVIVIGIALNKIFDKRAKQE